MIAEYFPGASVRFSTTVALLGVLTNPTTITLTLSSPDGSQIVFSSPTQDSVGAFHQDWGIPLSAAPGLWVVDWQTTGATSVQTGNEPYYIKVRELPVPVVG